MENQLHIALASNKLFKNISLSNLDLNSIKGNLFTIKEGEILFRENDSFNFVYFIISGELNLLSKHIISSSNSSIISDNDFLGHDEYLSKCNRRSAVVALRDSYLVGFNSSEMQNLIEQDKRILENLKNNRLLVIENDEVKTISDTEIDSDIQIPEASPDNLDLNNNSSADQHEPKSLVMNDDLDAAMNIEPENFESPDDYEEHTEDFEIPIEKNETEQSVIPSESEIEDFKLVDEADEASVASEPLGDELPIDDLIENDNEKDLFLGGISSEEELRKIDELINEEQSNPELENEEVTLETSDNQLTDEANFTGENINEEKSSDTEADEKDILESPVEERNELETDSVESVKFDVDEDIVKDAEVPEESSENLESEAAEDSFIEPEIPTIQNNDADSDNLISAETAPIPDENLSLTSEPASEVSGLSTAKLDMIIKAAEVVNSNIKIQDVLANIVTVAADLVNADRGTLYLVEKEKGKLWSEVAMGEEVKEIFLKIGEGIAGTVASTGEIINIADAPADKRFLSTYDKASGYKTKSILCLPIKNKEGSIVGVLQLLNSTNGEFTGLDEELITALSIFIALALENANLVEQLLKTERINSLGKMANFLINDIKKPVLVSKRYAGHLLEKELNPDIKQVLEMMDDQLNHVADLVQTTSSYSQGNSILRAIPQNINEVLNDFSNRLDSYLRTSNCTLVKEFGEDAIVKIDSKEFYQCFYQIVRNAVEAMPDGGRLKISTVSDSAEVKISFSDNGLGINESLHDKIFEPFMTFGKKNGTGLGLSITKKVIEDHGGTIIAVSTLGDGATFTITFPVANAI